MRQTQNLYKYINAYPWFVLRGLAEKSSPRPYKSIPGPRGPLGLGTIFHYLPVIGKYSWQKLHEASLHKFQKYGPIVRETIIPGQDVVWLYDPVDIETLLNEREYPQRRSHLALAKFRLDRPHIYNTAGLLPTNGQEWWRLRSEVQKEMSLPKKVRSYLPKMDQISKEFMDYLPKQEIFDILPKLARYNLELTFLVTFDARLEAFSSKEQENNALTTRLIKAAEQTNSSILPTDNGLQLWRYFETPTYKRLSQAQEFMQEVALEFVEKHSESEGLIKAFLGNPKLQRNDVVGMATDLILAGIDTTSYSMAFAVYHLARHEQVQQLLYEESCQVLPKKDSCLELSSLNNSVPYTRAVLKEVLRLNPISVGVGRILNQDLILSGYQLPKGSVVVTQNLVACRLENNFKNAHKFQPERWLNNAETVHPYLLMPFGHGMRACLARRFSEQNIIVFLLRLLRNYELIWQGGDEELDISTLLINKPSRPVNILLKSRQK